jgi:hypothetical protein
VDMTAAQPKEWWSPHFSLALGSMH